MVWATEGCNCCRIGLSPLNGERAHRSEVVTICDDCGAPVPVLGARSDDEETDVQSSGSVGFPGRGRYRIPSVRDAHPGGCEQPAFPLRQAGE